MRKSKIISIIIGLVVTIGNPSNAQEEDKKVLFKDTQIQLSKTCSISKEIEDISKYKIFNKDEFIVLNNSQVERWIHVFPNIGGHEFFIISINEKRNYISIYVLAKGDGGDQIHLINLKHCGSFMDALTILDHHRYGPKEENKRNVVIHTEQTNSIIRQDTIKIITTQTRSNSWESSEMFEEVFKKYFTISPNGKFNQVKSEK
ncbi:hypothetical protein [Marinifilum fragile]|uniref:hypothetical protein n=1 Tax=Marinifilum fragile TaxID=570161 RepID=UPI002AA67DC4|nr:hypothetical protein [Marinifilum fragile]